MIRVLALSAALLSTAPAHAYSDQQKMQGALHAAMILIVCGIEVPAELSREFNQLSHENGVEPYRLAEEVARVAFQQSSRMTAEQKDAYCYSAVSTYRRMGFLR